MRRLVSFPCEGSMLLGSLDEADGPSGVLVVSGGNEVRGGAHRGMTLLAQQLASRNVPVFRFDRRGVGDSEGANSGFASSGLDIAAALATFRREQPQVRRVIGFGNCDAATALALLPHDCDALVLANPWLGDEDAPPPPAALRAHYLRRLGDVGVWRRAIARGIGPMVATVRGALGPQPAQPLAARVTAKLGSRPTTVVLAGGDRTGQVFAAGVCVPAGVRVVTLDTASHSFAGAGEALAQVLLDAVASLQDKHAR